MDSPNGQPRHTVRRQPGDGTVLTPGPQSQFAQPPVPPSLEAVMAEFQTLVAANQAKFAELAAQGTPPDPLYLVHARINHLIDAIAQAVGPNGPLWAAATRLGFEKQIAAELAQAGPVTRRMQLAEGGRYTPEMIRALAAQTGTLHRRAQ
jgi:hypothetical protein